MEYMSSFTQSFTQTGPDLPVKQKALNFYPKTSLPTRTQLKKGDKSKGPWPSVIN